MHTQTYTYAQTLGSWDSTPSYLCCLEDSSSWNLFKSWKMEPERDSGEKYLQKDLELREAWEQFGLHSKQAGHAEG